METTLDRAAVVEPALDELRVELLEQAGLFEHAATYRAGVEDTLRALHERLRSAAGYPLPPAHSWFG